MRECIAIKLKECSRTHCYIEHAPLLVLSDSSLDNCSRKTNISQMIVYAETFIPTVKLSFVCKRYGISGCFTVRTVVKEEKNRMRLLSFFFKFFV